jgi:REP element-mobilizing transposase RayT
MCAQRHLKRLSEVWQNHPVYFVTTCVDGRRRLLASEKVHAILREEWMSLCERHGWAVGRYVIMPDHVHFFAAPVFDEAKPLALAIGKWKEWTSKRVLRLLDAEAPLWQPEFFDHLMRSDESRDAKWMYVVENPVRAGLVKRSEEWQFAGSIHFG